ncbi:MAG TPA: metallophosphoesterase family protein [Vicinamibacterales bacterium]|nr:metallophosphoesterase family protein [Vicinamibacterales bacterium]
MLVGLISDTHSLMRPQALAALHGVEVILHAGDVGGYSVLRELEAIAPVHAVSGNTDDPGLGLPRRLDLTLDGLQVHVSHGHELGSPTPAALAYRYAADVIVYGHTHKPLIERHGRALVVNPGAAGPRRFNLLPTVALLRIADGAATAEIVRLEA